MLDKTTVTTSDVLNRAAELIEEHGHCQGAFHSYRGDRTLICTAQAIFDAAGAGDAQCSISMRNARYGAVGLALDAVDKFETHIGTNVCMWNNVTGRTGADVAAALRAAA